MHLLLMFFAHKTEVQSKIHVLPACIKEINGSTYYLVHRRKKHPYYGWMGFPTGKIKFGESFEKEVIRELEEETGIVGKDPELKIVHHLLISQTNSHEILDDRVFFYF